MNMWVNRAHCCSELKLQQFQVRQCVQIEYLELVIYY